MSSDPTQPISTHLFALAIRDLPVDTLYAKAAEIQNSISHLLDSNIQLKPYADEGDDVCREAITENDAVVARMEERIQLCKAEVEGRGLRWSSHGANEESVEGVTTNGVVNGDSPAIANGEVEGDSSAPRAQSGRLTDDELRQQLEAQMGGEREEEEEDHGVHL